MTLKFKTDKSADVGRMIAGLGRVGRHMAALPEKTEGMVSLVSSLDDIDTGTAQDIAMEDAIAGNDTAAADKEPATAAEPKTAPPATGGGGGGKKKKKGKK